MSKKWGNQVISLPIREFTWTNSIRLRNEGTPASVQLQWNLVDGRVAKRNDSSPLRLSFLPPLPTHFSPGWLATSIAGHVITIHTGRSLLLRNALSLLWLMRVKARWRDEIIAPIHARSAGSNISGSPHCPCSLAVSDQWAIMDRYQGKMESVVWGRERNPTGMRGGDESSKVMGTR